MLWVAWPGLARGDDLPAIAAGFRAHVVNQKGGGIDWTSGEIIADGIAKSRSDKPADHLAAERAASLVAARNALALANGIQFDASGRVGNLRNGEIKLNGVVKCQRVVGTTWDKTKKPAECHVELRVPLWGVTGVCTAFSASQRRVAMQHGSRRLVLVEAKADVSNAVLVIDARGRKIDMCLFPAVVSEGGAVLYDIATRADALATSEPPVRYVETDLTYENLRACLEGAARRAEEDSHVAFADQKWLRGGGLFQATQARDTVELTAAAAFQPTTGSSTSQPTSRPSRRRVVVKAADPTPGKAQSQIVLTKEDAEKLRQSPEGANLLRSGKIIVVVDSAAAGIQGRLPRGGDDTSLASSAR